MSKQEFWSWVRFFGICLMLLLLLKGCDILEHWKPWQK